MEAIQQQPRRMKGLRFATRCVSLEQFIAMFQRHCDPQSVFVPTPATRPVGLETAFSIDLADGKPALRGLGVVLDAWSTPANRFGRPGICFGIRKLTVESEKVFEQMLVARAITADRDRAAAPVGPADAANTDVTEPPAVPPTPSADDARTPGGDLVLPANPLSGIADESLEGFVDCTIYEETGNFFPVEPPLEDPQDAPAAPPLLAPLPRRNTPMPMPVPVVPAAVVPAPPERLSEPAVELAPEDLVSEPAIKPPPIPSMAMPLVAPLPPTPMPGPAHPSVPPPTFAPVLHKPWLVRAKESWTELVRDPRRRWLVIALAALPLLVIVLVAALARSGSSNAAPPPDPVPAAQKVVHATATPSPAVPATAPTHAAVDPPADDTSSPAATPTVGSGPCRITVTTTPAGSIVEVDGARAGPSPITIAGPCQHRQLAISHPRYETSQRTLTPTADKPAQTVDVTLQRPMHHLMIETSPSGATISIGGHRAGTSPTNVEIMGFTSLDITIAKPPFYRPVTKRVYSKVPNDRLSVTLAH